MQSIRNGKKRGYKVERVKVRLLKDNEWISMGNRNLCWCQFRMLLKGEPCLNEKLHPWRYRHGH